MSNPDNSPPKSGSIGVSPVCGFQITRRNLPHWQEPGRVYFLRGPVWEQERYDRVIRDEPEFLEKWQYIRNNPLKQGLASAAEDYA
jgi:hypothetical protein